MGRAPAFAAVTVLTLALGIGVNTAIFSIVSGVILKPLGYPKPEQLMWMSSQFPLQGFDEFWVSPPEFFEFREINRSFSSVGAYTTGEVNLSAADRPLRVPSASVTDDLLDTLGLAPQHGRRFAKGETDAIGTPGPPGTPPPAAPNLAILSHELWQSAFGGRAILGDLVEINGVRREIIGIMPPGADVMDNRTAVWLPLGLNPANRQNRGNHFLHLIGRLRDGVSVAEARRELDALVANWGERVGATMHVYEPTGHRLNLKPMRDEILGEASRAIWVLQAAVGLVLLIACANLANLLLARADTRQREFAVRTALGAGRTRLLRQFLTEGLVLSLAGGCLGILLARAGVGLLVRVYPDSLPRTGAVSLDTSVLLFTLLVSLATGVIFGFAPLLQLRLRALASTLRDTGTRSATASGGHRLRQLLVVSEMAMAVILVVGAGLLMRTVYNLSTVDGGFARSRLVTFQMTAPSAAYPQRADRAQLYQRLLDRLRVVPGIQAATAMSGLPPNRPLNANDTEIDNYTAPAEGPFENVDYYQSVMSDYFETMGIPIVQGRSFVATDAASSGLVVVVNEALVNTFWKGLNPIGQRVQPDQGPDDQSPWYTVIGVAKDVKQGGVNQKTGTELYFLVDQTSRGPALAINTPQTAHVVMRTTLSAVALASAIESAVRDADPAIPVVRLRDMETVFDDAIRRPRLMAQLLSAFAGLALVLAAIGTYGVLSYMVAQRRREIGIRMALGAQQGAVVGGVMRQGLWLAGVGVVIGVAGALGLGRLVETLLFGVGASDPRTFSGVVLTMGLVAAIASWLPAWRASRVDPVVVLRDE